MQLMVHMQGVLVIQLNLCIAVAAVAYLVQLLRHAVDDALVGGHSGTVPSAVLEDRVV
jgi:F0F1-type ATP synthase assembly protein I